MKTWCACALVAAAILSTPSPAFEVSLGSVSKFGTNSYLIDSSEPEVIVVVDSQILTYLAPPDILSATGNFEEPLDLPVTPLDAASAGGGSTLTYSVDFEAACAEAGGFAFLATFELPIGIDTSSSTTWLFACDDGECQEGMRDRLDGGLIRLQADPRLLETLTSTR